MQADAGKGAGVDTVVAATAAGGKAVAVSKAAEAQGIIEAAIKTYGRLDTLVNNSRVYGDAPPRSHHRGALSQHFNINVPGLLLATQAAVKYLGEGSSIINIGSVELGIGVNSHASRIKSHPRQNRAACQLRSRLRGMEANRMRLEGVAVLTIDDDQDFRTLLKGTFNQAGAAVIEATSGEEALEVFETVRPDVVLPISECLKWMATNCCRGYARLNRTKVV